MNKLRYILSICFLAAINIFAQVPQAFNYQGLARDAQGNALANKLISIKASILTGSATGTVEYAETQTSTTNATGLFSLGIGNGTASSGTFSTINWATGNKYLKIEFDPNGGTNYVLSGTTQMLSVPYAQYAAKAGNTSTTTGTNQPQTLSLSGYVLSLSGGGGSVNLLNTDPNLRVSRSGDTLWVGKSWVLIPNISQSNSGNALANAGADIINSCTNSVTLNGSTIPTSATGLWTIESGTGGTLTGATLRNANLKGLAGQTYVLKWAITQNSLTNEDYMNVTFASSFSVTGANAGADQNNLMNITTTISGNTPNSGETGRWSIVTGTGGILANPNSQTTAFTGVQGQAYVLRWTITAPCFSSQDDVYLYFSASAAGVVSSRGSYYIPDPNFRQVLQVLHPTAMNGDSLKVNSVAGILRLNLSSRNISNLDGLQFLTSLKSINALSNNLLQSLPNLPNSLDTMIFDSQVSLPSLPNNLIYFSGNIGTLPTLPTTLKYLSTAGGQSATLPILPIALTTLRIQFNSKLITLPTLPSGLTTLYVNGCLNLTTLSNIPSDITNLEVSVCKLTSLPASPRQK